MASSLPGRGDTASGPTDQQTCNMGRGIYEYIPRMGPERPPPVDTTTEKAKKPQDTKTTTTGTAPETTQSQGNGKRTFTGTGNSDVGINQDCHSPATKGDICHEHTLPDSDDQGCHQLERDEHARQLYIDISNIIRSIRSHHADGPAHDGAEEPCSGSQSGRAGGAADTNADSGQAAGGAGVVSDEQHTLDRTYEDVKNPFVLYQELLFEKLVADMRRKGTAKESSGDGDEEGRKLSSRQLLDQCDNGKIITNFYEYQTELFIRSKKQNSIVVLDTGSGKTMIAVLLLKHVIESNLEDRLEGAARKICFFLVPSTPLVFQQAKTIQSHLPYPVESLCGALNTDAWDRSKWETTFSKYDIIVCTGEILNQCLRHGFIRMANIGIIIFDEVHHAKLNHVYAEYVADVLKNELRTGILTPLDRIARNHYHFAPLAERPRLFGMTASPTNSLSADVADSIRTLEQLMDGSIITSAERSFTRPDEVDLHYTILTDAQIQPVSPLRARIHEILSMVPEYLKLKKTVEVTTKELGLWAGDMIWKLALENDFRYRIERRLNKDHPGDIALLDTVRRKLDEVSDILRKHDFGDPERTVPSTSPKVHTLIRTLERFNYSRHDRALVFVEKRITAKLLNEMFNRPNFGPLWLKPGMLIGSGATNATLGEIKQSVNDQFSAILAFRKGNLNCLFSTSVAEEGLDIPDCNLVVRFDLYKSTIQYIQSRGRARHAQSRFYHLLEKNNYFHSRLREQVSQQEAEMRHFCKSLPRNRQVQSVADEVSPENSIIWFNPETGAKITTQSAVALIYQLASHFPSPDPEGGQAVFVTHEIGGMYQCEIIMPQGPPIFGDPAPKKLTAKRNAACRACHEFYIHGFFDDNLVPRISPVAVTLQTNDHLALDANKKGKYTKRAKPLQWKWDDDGKLPERLYMCVLDVKGGLHRPHRPLCLLTRTVVGQIPNFEIFIDNGETRYTDIAPYPESVAVSRHQLEALTSYTLRIFQDVFAKTYEPDIGKMTYWIAPLKSAVPDGESPYGYIDHDKVEQVHTEDPTVYWTAGMKPDDFLGRFMIDRWDKRRRGFSKTVVPGLRPEDPLPSSTAKGKYTRSILDYSISLWKGSRENDHYSWDPDQPVVEIELLIHRINFYIPPKSRDLRANLRAVICPQPFRISFLDPEHVSMAMVFPTLIDRIENMMVALEGVEHLQLKMTDPNLALEIFTVDLAADADEDTDELQESQRLNMIRMMGPSYERLEFLGDSFLKMAVSIELYCTTTAESNKREFELHENRKLLVCNSNMFETALERDLVQFARVSSFSRRAWYPHGLTLIDGKKTEDEDVKFRIQDKGVADICEAAIGGCFVEHYKADSWGPTDWDAAIEAVTTVTTNNISLDMHNSGNGLRAHTARSFADYVAMFKMPEWAMKPATEYMRHVGDAIFAIDGYRFNNLRLLHSAFTHQTSVLTGRHIVPSYQVLEFLGDSLLDVACVEYLHFAFPNRGPEWMTKHKMAIVSNQFFSALSVKLGFHEHINHCSAAITHAITSFADQVNAAVADPSAPDDFWTRLPEAPKFMSDVVEAYAGAIFVDSGFDFGQVRRFFRSHILPSFRSLSMYDSFASKHPVNALQRLLDRAVLCQSAMLRCAPVKGPPIPNTVDPDTGKPKRKDLSVGVVIVHDRVLAQYVASSARLAKTAVARQAVVVLEEMSREEYQAEYGCDCGTAGRRDMFT